MSLQSVTKDITVLVAEIVSPPDQMLLLRPSIESALLRLGHAYDDVQAALDAFYTRTLH